MNVSHNLSIELDVSYENANTISSCAASYDLDATLVCDFDHEGDRGNLIYAFTGTKPNLSRFMVEQLGFKSNHINYHFKFAKSV